MGAWLIEMVFEPLKAQNVGQFWDLSEEVWFMYWRYYINLNGVRGGLKHPSIELILDFSHLVWCFALLWALGAWHFQTFCILGQPKELSVQKCCSCWKSFIDFDLMVFSVGSNWNGAYCIGVDNEIQKGASHLCLKCSYCFTICHDVSQHNSQGKIPLALISATNHH